MKTGPKPAKFAAFVGIDWADRKHDYCIWDTEEETKKFGRIEHRPALLHNWILGLHKRFDGGSIAIGVEQSKGALVYLLMQYDFVVLFIINPATSAQYRKTWKPSRAKDDPTDAALIMELVRDHRDRLSAWYPEDADTRRLAPANTPSPHDCQPASQAYQFVAISPEDLLSFSLRSGRR